jgi:hypothetical protein
MSSLRAPLKLPEVKALMRTQLTASGLDPTHRGYTPLTAEQAACQYPQLTRYPAAGYTITYHDQDGKPTSFFRFRYVEEPSGFGKALRYIQPSAELPRVYWSTNLPWKKVLVHKDDPIFITEGEKKADCGCKHGLAVIGLGGVWSYKSKKANLPLLKELAAIDWDGRSVYIVYDSDAISNRATRMAEMELARQLIERKASVYVIRLPPSVDGKVGLDDFLVDEGVEEFHKLDAEEFSNSESLHQFNEKATVIVKTAEVLTFRNGAIYPFQKFEKLFASDKYTVREELGNGEVKLKEMPTAKEWLKWGGHNQVECVSYEPGQPEFLPRDGPHPGYNAWSGWGVEPEKGDMSVVVELVDYLLQECTKEQKAWLWSWLAYPIQNPGRKMSSCVLTHGGQGTGKSILGEIVGRIYGENYKAVEDHDLTNSFNEWCRNRQFVMGSEIGASYRKAADVMKSAITREHITVNSKFVAQYEIRDCINYYFTSNKPNAAYLDEDDRRHFIVNVPKIPMPAEFYARLKAFKDGDGPKYLMDHLLKIDLTRFDPKAPPPLTAAKERMIVTSRSDAKQWAIDIRDQGHAMLVGCPFATPSQLEALFDYAGKNKSLGAHNLMSTVLQEAGMEQVFGGRQLYLNSSWGKQRFWILDPKLNEKFAGDDAEVEVVKKAYIALHGKVKK